MTSLEWAGSMLGVLVAAVAYDFAYAKYTVAAAARQASAAASWSAITYLVGIVGAAAVLRGSLLFVIPEAVGLYIGTLLGVRRRR